MNETSIKKIVFSSMFTWLGMSAIIVSIIILFLVIVDPNNIERDAELEEILFNAPCDELLERIKTNDLPWKNRITLAMDWYNIRCK